MVQTYISYKNTYGIRQWQIHNYKILISRNIYIWAQYSKVGAYDTVIGSLDVIIQWQRMGKAGHPNRVQENHKKSQDRKMDTVWSHLGTLTSTPPLKFCMFVQCYCLYARRMFILLCLLFYLAQLYFSAYCPNTHHHRVATVSLETISKFTAPMAAVVFGGWRGKGPCSYKS